MSFRDFISNFRYRRRLEAKLERYQNIKPPENPSRRYIDKLVRRLLNEGTAWDARRELSMMGPIAVPSLVAALEDSRFHRVKWPHFSAIPAPLDSVLELLVSHAGNEVVNVTLPLVKFPSTEIRKTAALHLASVGSASTIPTLKELMQDEDGYVRSYVRIGIHRAVAEGRAEDLFRRQSYDLLLSQCDLDWPGAQNDAAKTIIVLDPARAAIDLADERLLNLSNRNAHRILEACNRENVLLPETTLRQLLETALPLAVGERCYPNDSVAAAALRGLALSKVDDAGAIAESLINHENERVKEAAADALCVLAGIPDLTTFVTDRVNQVGYDALLHEQRVVYCALMFDAEICNGGLMQFFGNSDYAVDTLAALLELPHREAYAVLDAAIKLVGPIARESDREVRLSGFEERWDELQLAFEPLEAAYFNQDVPLLQAGLLYAVRHADQFRA